MNSTLEVEEGRDRAKNPGSVISEVTDVTSMSGASGLTDG